MNPQTLRKGWIGLIASVCGLGLGSAWAQQQGAQFQLQTGGVSIEAGASGASGIGAPPAPPPSNAARYVQACQDALQQGQPGLGCNATLFNNELRRLQGEALETQNPALLTLVGEAYRNERSPTADIGQAYRWYLMAAVRGDPGAMERLSQMYQKGQGVSPDPVKALGYARLTQQFISQQSRTASEITAMIQRLGSDMAAEEVALSERFAQELEARIRNQPLTDGTAAPAPAGAGAGTTINIPGLRQGSRPAEGH